MTFDEGCHFTQSLGMLPSRDLKLRREALVDVLKWISESHCYAFTNYVGDQAAPKPKLQVPLKLSRRMN